MNHHATDGRDPLMMQNSSSWESADEMNEPMWMPQRSTDNGLPPLSKVVDAHGNITGDVSSVLQFAIVRSTVIETENALLYDFTCLT